jgi:uncharacterized protein YpmS
MPLTTRFLVYAEPYKNIQKLPPQFYTVILNLVTTSRILPEFVVFRSNRQNRLSNQISDLKSDPMLQLAYQALNYDKN